MLHLFVARQQFGQVERRSDFADPLPGGARPGHVIQEVVKEIVDRVLVECRDAFVDHELDLPVRLGQQPFQRYRRVESAVLQGLEHATGYPP